MGFGTSSGSALQCVFWRTKELGEVYGAPGARRSYQLERRSSVASPTTAMADGGARLAGELATAKGTARGEERRKGGAHRAATKSLRQLRSAEVAGDDGGHRRPRRKGAARSAACGAPRLAFVDGDEEADDGGAAGQVGEARRGWLPRLRRRTATEALGMMGGARSGAKERG